MTIFKIIISASILLGCKSPKKSFDSELSKLFFDANIQSNYNDLLVYFKKLTNLKEINSGWTIYPPLSALRQDENKIEQKIFEFHDYPNLSSGLKNGTLNLRKTGADEKAFAAIEITIEFNLEKEAEDFYKATVGGFNNLPVTKQKLALAETQSIIFHSNETLSVFIISLEKYDPAIFTA